MVRARMLTAVLLLAAAPAFGQAPVTGLLSRIAFGSGLDAHRPQPVRDAIVAANPELFVLLDTNPVPASLCEGGLRLDLTSPREALVFGPPGRQVQVILFGTRTGREPDAASLFPTEPWSWFRQQLRTPAQLRLICTDLQVLAEDHDGEKWMDYPRERRLLFNLISDTEADGVIFLSGSRRHAEISMMEAGVGYPLYDITPGSLNTPLDAPPAEINSRRISELFTGAAFGLITVNWSAPDPAVTIEIRDKKGEVWIEHRITLSSIGAADHELL